MNNKKSKTKIILISVVIIIMLTLWFTGVTGVWLHGMAYIANNTKEFTDKKGYLISDEYSISINLDNLESNIGKELYNDGECKVYVGWIDNTGNPNTGGYRIGFKSSGKYSINSATLVSGTHHETVGDESFRPDMVAKMTAKYKDKVYNSSEFGTGGLNYKDGDDFSFYIFPYEAYDKGEISLNEKGIVELSIKNLYKNRWTKK